MKIPVRSLILAAIVVAVALAWSPTAEACAVCFGDPGAAETKGLNNAIFFLLGIIALIQVGFVKLFWEFRKRAKSLEDRRKSFQVLRGGIRS